METKYGKSATKCSMKQIYIASLFYFQFFLGQLTIYLQIVNAS